MTRLNEMTYGELTEHIDNAIKRLRRKAYAEGYKRGKRAVIKGKAHGEISKGETAQEKRDRTVERAKEDVVEIQEAMTCWMPRGIGNYTFRQRLTEAEFVVNRKKRTVVTLVRGTIGDNAGRILERGIAKCAPNDCFNVHIGKAIALRRALGLDVPDEYLNAPQPTEVRKGDVVIANIEGREHTFRVTRGSGEKPISGEPHADALSVKTAKIIDDSREEGE